MTNMSSSVVILCVLVALQVSVSVASSFKMPTMPSLGRKKASNNPSCKDYELVLTKLEVCPESMVTFKDFNITLNDKCEIVPSGCVMTKAFETAEIKWSLDTTAIAAQGGNEHMSGESDGCKEMENIPDDALSIMKSMQLSTSCPMPEGEKCASKDTVVDMKKYHKFIPLMWLAAGTTTGDVNIKYNNGVSCVKFEVILRTKVPMPAKNPAQVMAAQVLASGLLKNFKI